MLARVRSAAVLGIDAYLVEVETDIASGLPTFVTVGLPQGAVKEGRDRVSAALANTGYTFPLRRITVNLAPADIRKEGSAFDLPIALGILAATEQIKGERLGTIAVLGELGLAYEEKVLDSRPFQRLRHIHQLALGHLVYPAATHRRFEHSLGVMELASRAYDVTTAPQHVHDEVVRQVGRALWETFVPALVGDDGRQPEDREPHHEGALGSVRRSWCSAP